MGRPDRVRFLYIGDLVQPESDRLGPGIILEIYEKKSSHYDSFTWIRILHSDGVTSTWGNDQLSLISRGRQGQNEGVISDA
jgi:hypothetical protein